MSVILVGVDDSERSEDAVAFADELARDSGAHVVVAATFPYDDIPSRAANLEFREAVASAAARVTTTHARRLAGLGDRVTTTTVARTSAAQGLQDLAESEHAALIVVGSTRTSRRERVLPGSTGERLLHDAPCAVAVVPRDYRRRARRTESIGLAWDGSEAADSALDAAAMLARALGARLRVIHVAKDAGEGPPAGVLPDGVDAEWVPLVGDAADRLCEASESLDLLVTGSRGYGPLRATLRGGVAGRVLRNAACPVIVVPRGVDAPLAGLFPT